MSDIVIPIPKTTITLIAYNQLELEEKQIFDIKDCNFYKTKGKFTWINIDGVKDEREIKKIGLYFHLHKLLVEDVCNIGQRPKVEVYDNCMFVSLKMLSYEKETQKLTVEQVSLVLGEHYLLSFQEDIEGDVFDTIREKLRKKTNGKERNLGSGYLFYLLLDAIVDNYIYVLEGINEGLEKLEDEIIQQNASRNPTKELYDFRSKLKLVHKLINPLREVTSVLIREENNNLEYIRFYLQDVHDHTLQVIDNTESYIDTTTSLLDLYLSILSQKTNDIMKFLTVFSSIFLPLTFIAGVYGMNFEYMPELKWDWGYALSWFIMSFIGIGTFVYFRMKKWI